ncbi:hypothetical protein [Streptomyces sp. NBC_00525]|uniref:hypothetical protein n=1 Tax=Streptomyces sp. NBC_00525 TaxID=2903660 RepID=UPI002E80BA5A|nr:hypothetical protein [Streptomyces sp. NBC_00525]WUC93371.1 hypothetical protein OG710_06980 [Streptomyces sp. NBC_00525]
MTFHDGQELDVTVTGVAPVGSQVGVDGEIGFIDQVKHPSWWDEEAAPPRVGDRLHVVVLDASREPPRFSALQSDIDGARGIRRVLDDSAGQLQIYSVEDRSAEAAVCVARCVGGVVRLGQRFGAAPVTDGAEAARPGLVLDRIIRYDSDMDFIEPPHGATVRLSGDGVDLLKRGVILTAAAE